jgi:hypothetical protein
VLGCAEESQGMFCAICLELQCGGCVGGSRVDDTVCSCSCNAWRTALRGTRVSLRDSLLASLVVM